MGRFGVGLGIGLVLAMGGALTACGGNEAAQTPVSEAEIAALSDGASEAAAMLGTRLKGRLIAAMREGGPEAAVQVCAEEAPVIAAEVSAETGYDVGRTALRVRNSSNAPDEWEAKQLARFFAEMSVGASPANLATAEVATVGGASVFRWAKPIALEAPCTACHGQEVDPALLAQIQSIYPDDMATGFAEGDLRGMFTVSKRLD